MRKIQLKARLMERSYLSRLLIRMEYGKLNWTMTG